MVIPPQKTWGIHWIHWVWGMKTTDLGMVGVEGKGITQSCTWKTAATTRFQLGGNRQARLCHQLPTVPNTHLTISSYALPKVPPKLMNHFQKNDNPCLASNNRYSPKFRTKNQQKKDSMDSMSDSTHFFDSIYSLVQKTSFKLACFSPV